jgi:hypothetical protein
MGNEDDSAGFEEQVIYLGGKTDFAKRSGELTASCVNVPFSNKGHCSFLLDSLAHLQDSLCNTVQPDVLPRHTKSLKLYPPLTKDTDNDRLSQCFASMPYISYVGHNV